MESEKIKNLLPFKNLIIVKICMSAISSAEKMLLANGNLKYLSRNSILNAHQTPKFDLEPSVKEIWTL